MNATHTFRHPPYTSDPHFSTPRLPGWLAALRQRSARITIRPNGTPTTQPFTPTDRQPLHTYRHALAVAAAGTHPTWWQRTAGINPDVELHIDDIPTVACPSSEDGLAFACACCGQPAENLDINLLPWCSEHG